MPAALAVLDVIAEPTRRRILDAVRDAECSVTDLVERVGMHQPGVSRHLKVLRDAGLVDVRRDAQRRLYRLNPEPLKELDSVARAVPRPLGRPSRRTRTALETNGETRRHENEGITMSNQSATQDGTLERTADGGWIRFERQLGYAIGDVWDAVTNPARLAEWWVPFDANITVDLQAGGQMVFAAKDESFEFACTILRLDPPTLLEHTHADPGSVMRWELEAVADGCVLRLSHFITDPADAIGKCFVVGLHTSLARLDAHMAGTSAPWDDIFVPAQAHYASIGLAPAPSDA